MLSAFIDAYLNANYRAIVKSGNPDEEQLAAAWSDILLDYYDLVLTEKSKIYLGLNKQMLGYAARIEQLPVLVQGWLISRSDDLKRKIASLGFHFQKIHTDEQILNQLFAHIKYLTLEMDNRKKDMENLMKTDSDGGTVTRQTFIDNLIVLNKEFGIGVNDRAVTLEVYALCLHQFNEIIQAKMRAA